MDSNPRHFFIDAVKVEANVDGDATDDYVTIEFAGTLGVNARKRIRQALEQGNFELTVKRLA
jgi:hypothetical protein